MKPFLKWLVVLLSITYPIFVYFGLQRFEAKWLLPVLIIVLGLRWQVVESRSDKKVLAFSIIALIILIAVAGHQIGLKFYPVLMNLGFFVLFASSLFTPVSFVERLARLKEPNLPPSAIIYTRKVTIVWSSFFVINGSISAFTVLYGSDELWLLYNGLIAYIIIALLASFEWLVRKQVRKA